MYDLRALEAALAGSTFAGKLKYKSITGSTNSDAMEAARNGAPHGSVFLADEQTAGRGRGDHAWASHASQGIYISVVLRLALPAGRASLLPLVCGLAAAEAIRTGTGLAIDLRWPNDLLIGARKVGGILVESQAYGDALRFAVAGTGINVHQREFPADLATQATSLDVEAGSALSRQQLVVALLESLERETALLQNENAAADVCSRVERASSWIRGRHVAVHGPQACAGITAGLDANGFLRLETSQGLVTVQTGGIRAAGVS